MSTPYLEPIKTTVVLTGEFMNECVCSNNKNTVEALLATTLVSDQLYSYDHLSETLFHL